MSNELRKHLENHRKPVGEFQREDRYIVIKRSDLKKVPVSYRSHLIDPMFALLAHLPNRECLVIESDWPEYEPAWKAIEARMSGAAPQPPALGGEPFFYALCGADGKPHFDDFCVASEAHHLECEEDGVTIVPLYRHAQPATAKVDERLVEAIAFVKKLRDAAAGQPSIATGYLSDILDVLQGRADLNKPQ